jgi:hypothetical protein
MHYFYTIFSKDGKGPYPNPTNKNKIMKSFSQ